MLRILAALTMVTVLLAGCSGNGGGGDDPTDDPTAGLGLEATDTTGIIRGVVVDPSITPLAGVQVLLLALNQTATTNDVGGFGFANLEPGTYFVEAAKDGYLPVRQGITVVAGEDEPPIARFQLSPDASFIAPYFEAFQLEGFIQCGTTTSLVAFAACSAANGCFPGFGVICLTNETYTQDNFGQFIELSGVPLHIQHELVWDATQATGDQLNLAMRTSNAEQFGGGSYGADIGGDVIGTSPLVGILNRTYIQSLREREDPIRIGENGTGLAPAVFAGGMAGTETCLPETPATNPGCTFSNGAAVNQRFTLFTHVFYGYEPPVGWRFSDASTVPLPP